MTLANDQLTEITESVKSNSDLYYLNWYVMQGDNTNADIAEFTRVSSGYFQLGIPYKVGVGIGFYFNDPTITYNSTNYSDNYKVIVEGEEKTEYTGEAIPITVKPMGETELEITIDSSKITTKEKIYDGKELDISGDIANGLITVKKKNTDEIVPITGEGAIALTYSWTTGYSSYTTQPPVNANSYDLYVSFEGDDNYKATDKVKVGNFTINPRELTVTPVLQDILRKMRMHLHTRSQLQR